MINREIETLFIGRYLDLWAVFNSGKIAGSGLRDAGRRYYQLLSEEGVDYKIFDRICKSVEKEFLTLGYDFNLAAYVLDCVRAERAGVIEGEENSYRQPIELPVTGEPIQSTSPEMADAIEKLKKSGLSNWLSLLERINAKKLRGGGKYCPYACEACRDTGWVPMRDNSVATCTCHKGQRIRSKDGKIIDLGFFKDGKKQVVKQATVEECKIAANGILANYEKSFSENAPF